MDIYPWQQELLDNPPRISRLYSPEEWKDIVLNELFEPNTMKGDANHMFGQNHTEQAKKAISDKNKGKTAWNKGEKLSPLSEEHKKKIGESSRGKKLTEEHKKKIGESNRGKKLSEETKKKIGESSRGRKHTEETKREMSKQRKGKPLRKITCPHCSKSGGISVMKRWHFDNCKSKA